MTSTVFANGVTTTDDDWFNDTNGVIYGLPKYRYSVIPIGSVAYGSLGTNTTPTAGTIYFAELHLDRPMTITGLAILNGGTAGGTNKHILALYSAVGVLLANSALAGVATSGPDTFQEIAFTGTYAADPGKYWVALQMDGNTDRFRSIAASTYIDVRTTSAAGAFGTLTALSVPTTFTADVGPIMYAYP